MRAIAAAFRITSDQVEDVDQIASFIIEKGGLAAKERMSRK
jgi:hypothetical protein